MSASSGNGIHSSSEASQSLCRPAFSPMQQPFIQNLYWKGVVLIKMRASSLSPRRKYKAALRAYSSPRPLTENTRRQEWPTMQQHSGIQITALILLLIVKGLKPNDAWKRTKFIMYTPLDPASPFLKKKFHRNKRTNKMAHYLTTMCILGWIFLTFLSLRVVICKLWIITF